MTELRPEERITISTYDDIAQIWSTKYHLETFWAKEMQRFNELLPAGSIIDVGCGGARDAMGLIHFGYRYVGIDISDKLLQIAKQQLPELKFYKQSIYSLKFKNKFDGFWCSAMLLHLPKSRIGEAIQSTKKVLRSGAIGFISLIDGSGEGLELETWDNGSQHQRFFAYYSKAEFTEILSNNGLRVVDYFYRKDSERFRWHCFFVINV